MANRSTLLAEDLAVDFGDEVARRLGRRVATADLVAALGAVSFQAKQTSSKLSPVVQPERAADGRRTGPRAVPPYCSATYASFVSCPTSCVFLTDRATGERRGCFVAANGFMMSLMDRLDSSARRIEPSLRGTLVGLAEAFVIDRAFADGVPQDGPVGGRTLRIHVGGDVANALVAEALSEAVARWRERGGGSAWCYTHRWRVIPRHAWGPISVLASVETPEAAQVAMRMGYAAALTAPAFAAGTVHELTSRGVRVLPCPAEQSDGSITCTSCRACFRDDRLHQTGLLIGFTTHGHQSVAADRNLAAAREATDKVRRRLPVL